MPSSENKSVIVMDGERKKDGITFGAWKKTGNALLNHIVQCIDHEHKIAQKNITHYYNNHFSVLKKHCERIPRKATEVPDCFIVFSKLVMSHDIHKFSRRCDFKSPRIQIFHQKKESKKKFKNHVALKNIPVSPLRKKSSQQSSQQSSNQQVSNQSSNQQLSSKKSNQSSNQQLSSLKKSTQSSNQQLSSLKKSTQSSNQQVSNQSSNQQLSSKKSNQSSNQQLSTRDDKEKKVSTSDDKENKKNPKESVTPPLISKGKETKKPSDSSLKKRKSNLIHPSEPPLKKARKSLEYVMSDDENTSENKETKKHIPSWAQGEKLKKALYQTQQMNLDKIFGPCLKQCNLREIFGNNGESSRPRCSGKWIR